jgi:hypothetical protein
MQFLFSGFQGQKKPLGSKGTIVLQPPRVINLTRFFPIRQFFPFVKIRPIKKSGEVIGVVALRLSIDSIIAMMNQREGIEKRGKPIR